MSTATAVDPDLLSILRCPETLQGLRLAEERQLEQLLSTARRGSLKNQQGQAVPADFQALLVREDGKKGYLVRDGIPVMLIDEAVAL